MLKIYEIHEIAKASTAVVGGKAKSLGLLAENNFPVPLTICVQTQFYRCFVDDADFQKKLLFETGRKDFSEMRWEEIWDCSLRIRNLFLRHEMPSHIKNILKKKLTEFFLDTSTAVRSSAPAEDSTGASFAGLHESYINVRGTEEIIKHIKLVWASLWSDAALLYRQELNLDIRQSAMAVVVQEVVDGDISGVAFSRNPNDNETAVIEAVFGLNQGLVDGVIEPDRWILARTNGEIRDRYFAPKNFYLKPGKQGVEKAALPKNKLNNAVLEKKQIDLIFKKVLALEHFYSTPQDMEWTFRQGNIFILQSRPVTPLQSTEAGEERSWYFSLRRSFANLELLRDKIVNQLIPELIRENERLDYKLEDKTADELIDEIRMRMQIFEKWKKVYWDEFIPFAHGIRIFGQFYNDTIKPEDPYEFLKLLQNQPMISLTRNRLLEEMAAITRNNSKIKEQLSHGQWPENHSGMMKLKHEFDDVTGYIKTGSSRDLVLLCRTVLQIASRTGPAKVAQSDPAELAEFFLSHFQGAELLDAEKFLDMGRCCYKLRDDDNIYLGRIEKQLFMAVGRAEVTLSENCRNQELAELVAACRKVPDLHAQDHKINRNDNESDRQITGQPAGPGLVTGKARIVNNPEDFGDFIQGEILVCDAIDPNMTFLVPLAAGIVERRGGMLIHGAIIAREYGIACVTGIPYATERISTGDTVTVDGYLGIVTIAGPEAGRSRRRS